MRSLQFCDTKGPGFSVTMTLKMFLKALTRVSQKRDHAVRLALKRHCAPVQWSKNY